MAEPTIQLGGGNWAGKSGNLLGYYEQNKKFYAEDFTFSRSTSGTRVNSSGLIETASVISTTEEVANGDFSTDTDWTKGSGWTISGGSANQDNSTPNSGDLTQSNVTTSGKKYKVTFDLVVTSGTISALVGGHNLFTTSGTKTFIKTATSSNLTFRNYSNFVGSIDNVSVKEVIENNIPRVDYLNNSNGSLILEPQRSNLVTYSSDFSQSSWGKVNLTPLSNTIISPDGNTNSTTFTKPVSGIPRLFLINIFPSTGVYTFSVFIKNINCNSILIRLDADNNTANCTVDLINNTLVNTGANIISSNLTEFANDWIRVDVTGNITSTAFKIDALNMFDSTIGTSIAIYGAQLEQGSYATSYIPTSGSSVTRNADACSITNVADRIGQTEGVFYWEGENIGEQFAPYLGLFADAPNTNNTRVMIYYTSKTTLNTQVRLNGVIQFTSGNATANGRVKVALAYKENDFVLYVNGSKISESSSGSTFTNELNNFNFNSAICKNYDLKIYNTRLSNSELATLTTL